MTKHIFITGGVVSSLGKGVTASALAWLLRERGYRVAMQKLDPYLNVDPGTMNPYEHGEVFVTDDGAETDLDLGHYERIAGVRCSKASNYTSGRIYSNVIARERAGGYLGGTVQVIPHVTDEIREAMRSLHGDDVDIAITEIGGTTGDIESLPFLEAARQFRLAAPARDVVFIHLTLVPFIRAAGELKTKPSQQSVAALRGIGITPDILVCRTEVPLAAEHIRKLSLFCNVPEPYVVEEGDVRNSIYEVPLELAHRELDTKVLSLLDLPARTLDLSAYGKWVEGVLNPLREVTIAVVGKYVKLQDAYKSVYVALRHGGIRNAAKVNLLPIEAEAFERTDAAALLARADGLLVPGGFGARGVEGKINALHFARENGLPTLGICLGMQCMVIEFARHAAGLEGANSTEFAPAASEPVIDLMEGQRGVATKGGTMRLGAYDCRLIGGTRCAGIYGRDIVSERHRHRYEFNPAYRDRLVASGLAIAGENPQSGLVELVELADHPFYVGCQFHPEFKSRPQEPHPLFDALVKAALKGKEDVQKN